MLWKLCDLHRHIFRDMSGLKILFEDRHLIAVVKPFGVMSQGNEKTRSICDDINEYLLAKGENTTAYVIHRLDKTTGGVMVFAKTKVAAGKMSTLIQRGEFHKEYLAVLCGVPDEKSDELADLLYHDKNRNKTYVVKRERKGVKKARLFYEVLCENECKGVSCSLVRVKLFTGRTHQIRVQFASRKFPLVGDRKYGTTVEDKTIALWSHKISFAHPFSGENIEVSALPNEGAFIAF